MLKETLEALDKIIHDSTFVELEGLDHGSAQDYGKPEPIA